MRNTIYWTAIGIAVGFVLVMILSGCTTTGPVIGSCPPDRCVGPYDLTLSSHREALTDGL